MEKSKFKFIRISFTTCYLLECNGGYLLIDTGYPKDYEKFLNNLKKKYNLKLIDIKYLLLTHHHDDHAGFAAELLRNSGAKLIVHEKAIKQLKLGVSEESDKSYYVNKRVRTILGIFERFHKFEFPKVVPKIDDIILRDSENTYEVLKNIGIDAIIIHTPGHTKDGISVIMFNGDIFPGDNSMNSFFFNILGIKKRPIYAENMELVFKSWMKYIEIGGKELFPAHGKPFDIKYLKRSLKKFKKNIE